RRDGQMLSARTSYGENETISFTASENNLRIILQGLYTWVYKPTRNPQVHDVDVYVGTHRQEVYQTLNFVRHGTATVTTRDGRRAVLCFQHGVVVSEGRCR